MSETTYDDLTGFLLGPLRARPGLYLGTPKITVLATFIAGYTIGYYTAKNNQDIDDAYFGENGFLAWYSRKYNVDYGSFWHTHFLEKTSNDEREALLLFLNYLEEFQKEKVK